MKIFDRLMLIIYSIIMACISIIIIVLPFNFTNILGIDKVLRLITNMKGNYIYSATGLGIFILILVYLISLFKTNKDKSLESYLVLRNEYGEILIYKETIVGLVDNVAMRFTGINNIKTKVKFFEGQVQLLLEGEASNEISIPETSKDLQLKIKEHIENTTSSKISEIRVEITSVTTPMSRLK